MKLLFFSEAVFLFIIHKFEIYFFWLFVRELAIEDIIYDEHHVGHPYFTIEIGIGIIWIEIVGRDAENVINH